MGENYTVFVHREPDLIKGRVRIVVRPGLLQRVEANKWKMTWSSKEWLFTDQQVHLLSLGGTIDTTSYGRLSISTRPGTGAMLSALAEKLALRKAS